MTRRLEKMPGKPKQVVITHGEASASDCFRRHLKDRFGWQVDVPEYLDVALLD